MSKKILVVEDTEDNRQILRDLLGMAGYDLVEAHDGAEGVHPGQSRAHRHGRTYLCRRGSAVLCARSRRCTTVGVEVAPRL